MSQFPKQILKNNITMKNNDQWQGEDYGNNGRSKKN